ncbi:MAG: pseudouridine synthase [Acidobacteriota bacterium]
MSRANPQRLQKILARAGVASRRASEDLIEAGRVTVNGQVATLGDSADPQRDAIKVDGKRVQAPNPETYLLLNKPRAVMSTRFDPEGRPTVMDLVPPPLRKALVPVGRLDFLTEGLLLLTDDGDFAHRVAHPRYGCRKLYEVKVKGEPQERDIERLRAGIFLDGKRTRPAVIERRRTARRPGEKMSNSWWTVEIGEGRTRQIRDMFQRIGHPVSKLRRVAIGPLRDDHLGLGEIRPLTEREVAALMRTSSGKSDGGKKAAGKGLARGPAKGRNKKGPGGPRSGSRPGTKSRGGKKPSSRGRRQR